MNTEKVYNVNNTNKTDTWKFLMSNDNEDLDRFCAMGAIYVQNNCTGVLTVNVSRRRKYIIDREDDVLRVKDNWGFDILEMPCKIFKSFLRELRVFCTASLSSEMKGQSFEAMEKMAG